MITDHSHSDSSSEENLLHHPNPEQKRVQWRKKLLLSLGSVMLVTLGGSLTYGWFYLQRKLPPIVEQELANFLNRPVEIGKVQFLTLGRVRFGNSEILSTATDPAEISLQALDIRYNPWVLLIQRKLKIDVTAIAPEIYLEQGKDRQWLLTPFDPLTGNHPVNLNHLRWKDASVVILARSPEGTLQSPVKFHLSRGNTDLVNNGDVITFDLKGNFAQGGKFAVSGAGKPKDKAINLTIQGNRLSAKAVDDLLPLPLSVSKGTLDTNLDIRLRKNHFPQLQGIATLHQVSTQVPQLPQSLRESEGQLLFKGTEIYLEEIEGFLGEIPVKTAGKIDITGKIALNAITPSTPLSQIIATLKLPKPPIPLSATLQAQTTVTGQLHRPSVAVKIQTTQPTQIDRLKFKEIKADLSLNKSYITVNDFIAFPRFGGQLQGKGKIDLGSSSRQQRNYHFTVALQNIPTHSLANQYQTQIPLDIKTFTGNFDVSGQLNSIDSLKAMGKGAIDVAGTSVQIQHLDYQQKQWTAAIATSNFPLASLSLPLSDSLNQGYVQGNFKLAGNTDNFSLNSLKAQGNAIIAVAGGQVNAPTIQLNQGQWYGDLNIDNLEISKVIPDISAPLQGNFQGNLQVSGNLTPSLSNIQANGQGNLTLPSGVIHASQLKLNQGKWQAQVETQNLATKSLIPNLADKFDGKIAGNFQLSGNVTDSLTQIKGQGKGKLSLTKGEIYAKEIHLAQGQVSGMITPENLPLSLFNSTWKGNIDGEVEIASSLSNLTHFNPQNWYANGKLIFSQGLGIGDEPLTTVFAWEKGRLNLLEAKSSTITAKGAIDLHLTSLIQPNPSLKTAIEAIDLNVTTHRLNLQTLPLPSLLSFITPSGQLNFDGTIRGKLQNPEIEGKIALINLRSDKIAFEPVLEGEISKNNQNGSDLSLAGQQDYLQVSLNSRHQPTTFDLQLQQMSLTGMQQNQQLFVEANQIPLPLLQNLAQSIDEVSAVKSVNNLLSEPMSGIVSGNLGINLDDSTVYGKNIQINDLKIGNLKSDRLRTNFHYHQGLLQLQQTQLRLNDSLYQLDAVVQRTPNDVKITTKVAISQGNVQDILESLQIFELSDFNRGSSPPTYDQAQDLYANPPSSPLSPLFRVGLPQAPLSEQLTYFSNIQNWLQNYQENQQKTSPIPELAELAGKFNGNIALNGSLASGFTLQFDLTGNNWQWGEWKLDHLLAKGTWNDENMIIDALKLESKESSLNLALKANNERQEGKLELVNVPLTPLATLVNLSDNIGIEGGINAAIAFGGTRQNPYAQGNTVISQAKFAHTPLNNTQGQFIYKNSRLDFALGSDLGGAKETLTVRGTIPYQFPFATIKPNNERAYVNINLNDEGFALLNIITNEQLNWVDGKGKIELNVTGLIDPKTQQFRQLTTSGIALVENGILSSKILPDERLTNVNGKISLNLDRLTVENLSGQFSGGKISMGGTLPLIHSKAQNQPLTLTFDNLALDFPNFYQGGVKGQVAVTGSVFAPLIGGQVELFDGNILLGESLIHPVSSGGIGEMMRLNQLKLTLGEKIDIIRPPVLGLSAKGTLILTGTLDQPLPEGTITLNSGQVNLFASQLRLVGGENKAEFSPKSGLDPYLNIDLATSVAETTRNTVRIDPSSSEINDPFTANRDSLQTVRIEANVTGFASQLTNKLTLQSTPRRSQQEIITLLGGGFVNTFGQGDTTLGLANLAGSALGPVQGEIGAALGLSEFRIFPTPLINEQERLKSNQIGIAAEAGIDVTENLSFSVLKILNSDRSPQWGLRYRINENTVIRGSSNFNDDSRAIVEYEQRF